MAFTKITTAGFGLTTGTLVGVAASFSSTVSVGGTLTYEDVTNVDSVGLITARNGIEVTDKGVQVGTGATVDSAAANTLTFLTGGSERIRIQSDGDVGIGTDDPGAYQLHVHSEDYRALQLVTNNDGANGPEIRLRHNSTSPADDDTIGQIVFTTNDSGGNQSTVVRIDGIVTDVTDGSEDGVLTFSTRSNGSFGERLRLDSSGRLLLGTTTARTDFFSGSLDADIQVEGSNYAAYSCYATNGNGAFIFGRDNGASGSTIGNLSWQADDGTDEVEAARISAQIDGTPGSNDMPGRLVFSTTADGASSPTERMRIDSSGNMGLGTASPSQNLHIYQATDGDVGIRIQNNDGFAELEVDADELNYNADSHVFNNQADSAERMRIDSSGNVKIGTRTSQFSFLTPSSGNLQIDGGILFEPGSGNDAEIFNYRTTALKFGTGGAEKMRLDGSGRLLVGTTTEGQPSADNFTVADSGHCGITIRSGTTSEGAIYFSDGTSGDAEYRGQVHYDHDGDKLRFSTAASTRVLIDGSGNMGLGTNSPTDHNGFTRIFDINGGGGGAVYCRTAGSSTNVGIFGQSGSDVYVINKASGNIRFNVADAEKMRIDSSGRLLVGKTSAGANTNGSELRNGASGDYAGTFSASSHVVMLANRNTDDGVIIRLRGQGNDEGSISVSGSTVSYNGAHLARWSQLPGGAERTEILRGSVLSNLDEMCEWGDENNEQLNRMKVSDVEGDINVAGVFQDWDDDDDTYTNDFYCAMTGDFVIRIASGVTVQRGNLLMSAGDGTAKPQGDGYIQDKTIAKVTSTTVSTTYSDGSYCVPCVLMAC